mmetsp:Transcript_763/g.2686  ORF Transcript_763/g.2686 Transcript_763/m.2686 type:complete len:250 (+) Transcript_763:354-1103(+)
MFFLRFLLAKYKELTSSDALDAKGVRTKDAKNGEGRPKALLRELTAPTMGSAKSVTMAMPIARKSIAFLMICDFVMGSSSSSSSTSLSSSSPCPSPASCSGADPSRGSRPACAGPLAADSSGRPPPRKDPSKDGRLEWTEMFLVCSSTQCVIPAQNSARDMRPSPSLSNSLSQTSTSPSDIAVSCIVTLIATSASLSSWTSTSLLPSASNCSNILFSAWTLTSPSTRMPPMVLPRCAANIAPRFLAALA